MAEQPGESSDPPKYKDLFPEKLIPKLDKEFEQSRYAPDANGPPKIPTVPALGYVIFDLIFANAMMANVEKKLVM
eukprot:CAMPEP_0170512624 /NCGR_PEP_ID=MMETSP0208-20121228/66952_1 /TAXON_ID=197538 /ORGANISM="Strombidium inclinatum, Strain S3" /LENGTH=74 /DNA_ID=CAMNT_0010796273 /DNA_START=1691 /DNA_END=1916 /DNA_ORIENTATION=-